MVKKRKDEAPNPNNVPNRDIIQRLNFLYQASMLVSGIPGGPSKSGPSSPSASGTVLGQKKRKRRVNTLDTNDLAKRYIRDIRVIGKKTLVQMCVFNCTIAHHLACLTQIIDRDPSIKRTMCAKCDNILIPGYTSTVRVHCKPSPFLSSFMIAGMTCASYSFGHAWSYGYLYLFLMQEYQEVTCPRHTRARARFASNNIDI